MLYIEAQTTANVYISDSRLFLIFAIFANYFCSYLKTALEALANHIQSNWVDA